MKKLYTLIILLISLNANAKYQFIESSFGSFMLQNYPGCVSNPEQGVYILDTLCSSVMLEDSLLIWQALIGSTDLIFFKNLKYINFSMSTSNQTQESIKLPISLSTMIVQLGSGIANNPDISLDLPPNLEKFGLIGIGTTVRFYYNSLPNTLRSFEYGSGSGGNAICYITNIPDSLRTFTFHNEGDVADTISVLPSFENAIHFESFLYLKYNNTAGLTLKQLPTFPSSTRKIEVYDVDIDSIMNLPLNLEYFICKSPSSLDYIYEFPPNLKSLSLLGNFSCLPPYPETLESIGFIQSPNFYCHPNYIPVIELTEDLCSDPVLNVNDCPALNSILGYVYHDLNTNCQFNASDLGLYNIPLTLYDANDNFIKKIYSQANGFYAFSVPDGDYKIAIDTSETNLRKYCAGQDYAYTFSLNDLNSHILRDFELKCDTLLFDHIDSFDVQLYSIGHNSFLFPGLTSTFVVRSKDVVYNEQLTCNSGIEQYLDSMLSYEIKITGPVSYVEDSNFLGITATQNEDTLILTYSDSIPTVFNMQNFAFVLKVDTTAQMDDVICVVAKVLPPLGDVNVFNNTYTRDASKWLIPTTLT
jgi:hypothetical protein